MSIIIQTGDGSGNLAGVTSQKNLQVTTPLTIQNAGFATLTTEMDAGIVTGERHLWDIDCNEDYALRVGVDNVLFHSTFNGTVQDKNKWTVAAATSTITLADGFINLNANSSIASGAYATLTSYRVFQYFNSQPFSVKFRANIVNPDAVNIVAELGIGFAATNAAPSDGVFFRWGADGTLTGVINKAGVEIVSSTITVPSGTHTYKINILEDHARFFVDDIQQAYIYGGQGDPNVGRARSWPLVARVYNAAVASRGCRVQISNIEVVQNESPIMRPFADASAGWQRHSQQGDGTWATPNIQSNWTNSISATAMTLSNTAAPSGGITGASEGGIFYFRSLASANTDLIVFDYLVPIPSAAVEAKTLYITEVNITTSAEGAAFSETTPTILAWCLGLGSTQINLTTAADGSNTRAPRRIPLGIQSWPLSAARGTPAQTICQRFQAPVKVDPGTYLHVIVQEYSGVPYGTVAIYFRGVVSINGMWE